MVFVIDGFALDSKSIYEFVWINPTRYQEEKNRNKFVG
jgi:hypothetical protein